MQLTNQFEASIATLPGVAAELSAVKAAAQEVAAREANLKAAQRATERAENTVQRRKSELVVLRKLKTESDAQLKQVQEEIRRLQLDLRSVNGQLADALDGLTGIRAHLRGVVDALRAIGVELNRKK
jgi:septal ring factor EnvC (AmiA/AmiB activator)